MRYLLLSLLIGMCLAVFGQPAVIKYHGVFPGGPHGISEDATPEHLDAYEKAVGHKADWVMISNEWGISRAFPALGFSMNRSYSTLRIGLGRNNTREEIQYAVDFIAQQVDMLRGL